MSDATTQSAPRFVLDGVTGRRVTWQLHVLAAPDARLTGTVLKLDMGVTYIGREPVGMGADSHLMAVDDATMSRTHAALVVLPSTAEIEVRDLGSRNGTWVDGGRIEGRRSAGRGSILRAGALVCVVEADDGRYAEYASPSPAAPGVSASACRVRSELATAARDTRPVLIIGPSGSGKERAAGEIHALTRRGGRLVRMNIAAVPETLFESELFGHVRGAFSGALEARPGRVREADGGTLVLDEIGELPVLQQAKLLRLLEEPLLRPVGGKIDIGIDVKFVAATNADLDKLIADGRFRQDLAARLRSHVVCLGALRDRRADIVALADAVVPPPKGKRSWAQALTPDVVELLALHEWP
ncbi:MAG: sigma-54-dependent Fis family transcriptional regulator, partial [Myxococcota bacterium]